MLNKQASDRIDKLFEGYTIQSATIYSKKRILLILKESPDENVGSYRDEDFRTEAILINANYNKDKHGVAASGWKKGVGYAWAAFLGDEKTGTVLCDSNCGTYEFESDEKWEKGSGWQDIADKSDYSKTMLRMLMGCRTIADQTYIFGIARKLYKRVGKQKWMDLTNEQEHPNLFADLVKVYKKKKNLGLGAMGFHALDGFNGNDIYGCGNKGDLWHYNGRVWMRLDLPTNETMDALVCAGNGYVYVAGVGGQIFKGRYDPDKGESWKKLPFIMENYNSLAWFKDKVYIGVDSGLYTIDDKDEIKKYVFPENGPVQYSFREVTACDEALLSYGPNQAIMFDGEKWEYVAGKIIVHLPPEFMT